MMWTMTLLTAMAAEPRIDGGEDFAAALYEQVAAAGDANVIISPTSARSALLMTWAGADGATRDAMGKALAISGDDALAQYTAWSKAMEVDGAPFELPPDTFAPLLEITYEPLAGGGERQRARLVPAHAGDASARL